jgi:hypothetical protein
MIENPDPEIEQLYRRLVALEKAVDELIERLDSMVSTEEEDEDG